MGPRQSGHNKQLMTLTVITLIGCVFCTLNSNYSLKDRQEARTVPIPSSLRDKSDRRASGPDFRNGGRGFEGRSRNSRSTRPSSTNRSKHRQLGKLITKYSVEAAYCNHFGPYVKWLLLPDDTILHNVVPIEQVSFIKQD